MVHKELAATMGEGVADINLATQPPAVILMAGLQGAGKTTTTAKLAKHLIEKRKKKVLTVSATCTARRPSSSSRPSRHRPGAEWFPSTPDQKPRDIALAALDHAKKHYFDVLLVDTAGRLAIDEALMAEIKDLHAALKPVETLFVVDAMQGQDAVNTAKAFKEALPLTGIVLTKLDGDSRGGAALSVRADHRGADQVRRRVREDRRPGGVRRRAPRRPRAGHGRHRGAGRGGHQGRGHRGGQKLADKVKSGAAST
jgi:signal recognition particle subunit SRP54